MDKFKYVHLCTHDVCACGRCMHSGVNFTNILRVTYSPIVFAKKVQTENVSTKELGVKLLYKKATLKKLVKLTATVSMMFMYMTVFILGLNI
jgi:hypothetical protein